MASCAQTPNMEISPSILPCHRRLVFPQHRTRSAAWDALLRWRLASVLGRRLELGQEVKEERGRPDTLVQGLAQDSPHSSGQRENQHVSLGAVSLHDSLYVGIDEGRMAGGGGERQVQTKLVHDDAFQAAESTQITPEKYAQSPVGTKVFPPSHGRQTWTAFLCNSNVRGDVPNFLCNGLRMQLNSTSQS